MLRRVMMAGAGAPASDPHWANVVALLHFDGADGSTTFTDQTGKVWTPFGNAQLDTSAVKYGAASGQFDGAGDYLTTPSSTDFDFGTGDFTIEFWLRVSSAVSYGVVLTREWGGAPYSGGFTIFANGAASGSMEVYCGDYNWYAPLLKSSTAYYVDSAWHHFAVVRNGTSFNLYIDGTSYASATSSFAFASVSKALTIGRDLTFGPGGERDYNGRIEDLRITKGVARYTANFTPPTAAFPNS